MSSENYIKEYKKILVLPMVRDFRGYIELSRKAILGELVEKDHLFWLKDSGQEIIYKTIKIGKDRISLKLRREVFEKCGYFCLKCGSEENLSIDHIYPESLCGETVIDNLQVLCRRCNSKKGAKVEK